MVDDSTLLVRFSRERREADFAEIVRRHLGLVYRVALRRAGGDTYLAEDITQQVFATLAREAHVVKDYTVLEGWLYTTTRNAAANAVRTECRRQRREQEAYAMNELTSPDNPEADWDKIRPELDRVLDELPESDRHALLMRFFANHTFGEIGGKLRLSENAARMRVERALDRLRNLLGKRGIVSTSAALTALLAQQASASVPSTLAATIASTVVAGGASAVGAAGMIAFMGTTKMLSITGMVTCLAAGIMLYEGHVTQQVLAAVKTEHQQNEAIQSALRDIRGRTEASNLREREAAAKRDALQKRLSEPGNERKAPASSMFTLDEQLLYSDPEYQKRFLEERRLRLRRGYAALYKKLNLTPRQIEDFEAVDINTQQAAIDLRSALFAQGVAPSDPSFKSIYNNPRLGIAAERDKRLREIIGENGLLAFKAYEARPPDITATSLALDLYYSATPLTVDQAFKLDDIVTANSTYENSQQNTDWEGVINQAQGLLATPQVEALKKRVEKKRIGKQMQEMMNAHLTAQP